MNGYRACGKTEIILWIYPPPPHILAAGGIMKSLSGKGRKKSVWQGVPYQAGQEHPVSQRQRARGPNGLPLVKLDEHHGQSKRGCQAGGPEPGHNVGKVYTYPLAPRRDVSASGPGSVDKGNREGGVVLGCAFKTTTFSKKPGCRARKSGKRGEHHRMCQNHLAEKK